MCKFDNPNTPTSEAAALFPPQAALLEEGFLRSDDHWLISTPTGSGKTRMGEWAIERALTNGFRAVYVAPLRALVDERFLDWRLKYQSVGLGAFTGDTALHSSPLKQRLLLFTPEKLAALLSSWKRHLSWLSEISVLVIDEIHLLADPNRGPALESLIGRIERINPFIQIVGLSATLPNAQEVANWLKARLFESGWRPVPITHRARRFKRSSDKPQMLVEEVKTTVTLGGSCLVFVNSRRRAEALSRYLTDCGLRSDYTHAGLDAKSQSAAHSSMRGGELDVLVATSTLEMGVNFPARKVIVYDGYSFEGDTFQRLSVRRYLQFAGRAGRPGLDPSGESVLFAPQWDGDADRMLTSPPEPVGSALFSSGPLLREILYEISTRLSVSECHLETNFAARTFWRAQGGVQSMGAQVKRLVMAGLLSEKEKDEKNYLSATALGRVATQMSITPTTAMLFKVIFDTIDKPSEFDILFAACLATEVTPKLGFNFEEIDEMADLILQTPSALLDKRSHEVLQLFPGINERTLLSGVKCAVILFGHTRQQNLDHLASQFDCYLADLAFLKRNAIWILEAAQRIFAVLGRRRHLQEATEANFEVSVPPSVHEKIVESLKTMVAYGIPQGALELVLIEGVGPKRAQRLSNEGVFRIIEVVNLSPAHLADIIGSGVGVAERILGSAKALRQMVDETKHHSTSAHVELVPPSRLPKQNSGVDPYRLRRALELRVDHLSAEVVRVSGGAEPHTVSVTENAVRARSYSCDCADFAKGHSQCKHILRARLALHDDGDLRPLLRQFADPGGTRALRLSLAELWMKIGKSYDAYNGRKVDYTGATYLDVPIAGAMRKRQR
jgi:helicase